MYELLFVTCVTLIVWRNTAAAVFLHKSSLIPIHPPALGNHSDFGFAMGFQHTTNNLVVGAPNVDIKGKVYNCNVGDFKNISCLENLYKFRGCPKCKKDQHFYMGSSIAVTSNNSLSCAPLWTNERERVFGTCYINDRFTKKSYKYEGTYEQHWNSFIINGELTNTRQGTYVGGTGWSTLADEDNGLFIISKTSWAGDIVYVPIQSYQDDTKSMVRSRAFNFNVDKFYNFGYGITSGKFFSNNTVYAFSMINKSMYGIIEFLGFNSTSNELYIINKQVDRDEFTIQSKTVGSMFGSMLAAADLNMDGFADLLVAAPVYTEEDCVECGAVHIYLGGEMATIKENMRIKGAKDFGRFSTAIAARDIDGDSIPELVVSAPYEDEGLGAVYIISGYELRKKLKPTERYIQLQPWDFEHTQRIQTETFRTFGYSLQFIQDADDNGCNELAVGSPGSGTAVLFKGIQTINVTLSSALYGTQVREQDANFTIKVCATVEYPKLPSEVYGNLTVINSVIGEASELLNPKFDLDISCRNCPKKKAYCTNVMVGLKDRDPHTYTFKSEAKLITDHIVNSTEFFNTWVIANPHYSHMDKRIEVSRHCKDEDCKAKLSMDLLWSGSEEHRYVLGSTASETVTIRVRNDGASSYDGCVWVQVSGAPLSLVECSDYNGGYTCYLQKPLGRDTEQLIPLILNMTKPITIYKELKVNARLFENCNQESIITDTKNIAVQYVVPTDRVFINSKSHSRNFTEKEMGDSASSIFDDQEYLISNNDSILWKNVVARVSMKKNAFIHKFMVSADKKECKEDHTGDQFNLICNLDLLPNTTQRIIATAVILKSDIGNGKFNTSVTSDIELFLAPTNVRKSTNTTTKMTFTKELTWANNKWLIAVIAGLIALLVIIVIITILYRIGFFKRKQKQRLHVFRESLKVRNSRRNTHVSSVADGQGIIDIDVVDDPFEDIPIPPNKQVIVMSEEKAQGV